MEARSEIRAARAAQDASPSGARAVTVRDRAVGLAPRTLRWIWRCLDGLTVPRSFKWLASLLALGCAAVAVGWACSLPVVLPGDGFSALERVLGLTARTLTFGTLPIDAPPAHWAVPWGIATVLAMIALAIAGLLLRPLRLHLDRFLISRARELSLLYADRDAGSTVARFTTTRATAVRLGASGRPGRAADVSVPLDEHFFARTLPRCADAVRELIALGSSTAENLRLARELVADRSAPEPLSRIFIRIDQRQARSALGRDAFGGFAGRAAELRLTSVPSARCRRLLREQLPIKVRSVASATRPALVVIGLADTGFELVCKLIAHAQSPRLDPLIIVLVDAAATAVCRALKMLSPALDLVVTLVPVGLEARLPESAPHLITALAERELCATCVYLAADEAALVESWHRELDLAYRMTGSGCPLILPVRFPLVGREEFSLLEEDEALDTVPRRIHDGYLGWSRSLDAPAGAAAVSWQALPFDYQEDNRSAADHFWMKARELDLAIGPEPCQYGLTIPTELMEPLARAEHRRWVASRAIAGWRFGTERDDNAKRHPGMQAWDVLAEKEREKDRAVVLETARALEAAGQYLRPVVRFRWPDGGRVHPSDGTADRVAAAAVERAQARAPSAVANVAILIGDAATFEQAQALTAHPQLTVSLLLPRPLGGFARGTGDATLIAQRLAERAWELWQGPEGELEAIAARWPELECT